MVSDKKASKDPVGVSHTKKGMKRPRYDGRKRFYTSLLLFVVIIGLPVVTVSSLRYRLETRIAAIKDAVSGRMDPVTAEISEKSAPFPKEYKRYAASFPGPGEPLPIDRIFTAKKQEPNPESYSPPGLITPESSNAGKPATVAVSPEEERTEPGTSNSASENGLEYTQGEVERDAYDLVLESYPKVAEMVKGSDPSLRFLSWGAVKRGDDLYWVRLIFQNDENPKIEYIWRVELESKQILPLSYNARSIS